MAIQRTDIDHLLSQLNKKEIQFSDVLQFIETHYTFQATAFRNGEQNNAANENQGSAKVLSFAQMNDLAESDTLQLFAEHYADVLATPDAPSHQNIRQFIRHGWTGVRFESPALIAR